MGRSTGLRARWHKHRERAKRRGLQTDLTFEDFEALAEIENCRVCGEHVQMGASEARTWTIDRLNTELGYVAGNLTVMCLRCNRAKGQLSHEELEQLARFVKNPTVDF